MSLILCTGCHDRDASLRGACCILAVSSLCLQGLHMHERDMLHCRYRFGRAQEHDGYLAGSVPRVTTVLLVLGCKTHTELCPLGGRGCRSYHLPEILFDLHAHQWACAHVAIPGGMLVTPVVRSYDHEIWTILEIAHSDRLGLARIDSGGRE